jgi:hypothetical protein
MCIAEGHEGVWCSIPLFIFFLYGKIDKCHPRPPASFFRVFKVFIVIWQDALDGELSPQGLYLHTKTQTQGKHSHVSIPRVRFEPTIPVFGRQKTVYALHSAVTVVGKMPPGKRNL